MAAVAANDEGNVALLAASVKNPRITLVVMGMARQERVRVHAFLLADLIDLLEHDGAAAVIATSAARFRRRRIAVRRVVCREQDGARVILLLDPLQLRAEKV